MSEYKLRIGDTEYSAKVNEITSERARIVVNDTEYTIDLLGFETHRPAPSEIARPTPSKGVAPAPSPSPRASTAGTSGSVRSPLPGLILEVRVAEGQGVKAGQPVVLMEAMKMENMIPAPHDGTVKKVFVASGDSVGEGDVLVEIGRPEMTTL